jgi:ribosomal protein S27E
LSKRKHERFVRRLETEFSGEGKNYRGISSDLSHSGLFIRTNHAFPPGTIIDILIHLPGGSSAKLKGRVRRALRTAVVSLKNGMGIELTEKDASYTKFLSTFAPDEEETARQAAAGPERPETIKETPQPDPVEYMIVACAHCNVRNRVIRSKMALGPKCGKCGQLLIHPG